MRALSRRRALHARSRAAGRCRPTIERRRIHTSFIQRLPFVDRLYRHYLPLFPTAVEQFDLDRFDLVLSISHCCVKSVITPGARAPSLLLPDADALRLGPVRRVLRPGAARPSRQPADAAGHGRGWPAGTATRRTAWTAMSLSLIMLRAGSADTIIARRQWCIRPSTPFFTIRMARPLSVTRWSCRRSFPTSESTWPSRRAGAPACR